MFRRIEWNIHHGSNTVIYLDVGAIDIETVMIVVAILVGQVAIIKVKDRVFGDLLSVNFIQLPLSDD